MGQYTNINLGNTATFSVAFVTSAGVITVPTSATLTVTYNSNKVSQVTTIGLTIQNSFWTGSWNTNTTPIPDLGLATYVISSPLGLGTVGQIQIVQD